MKILYLTDSHFRDTNPINRLDDFYHIQFSKMKELKDICENEKVNVVIFGGDLFDNPTPSYELFNNILDFIINLNSEIYGICGSHDLYGYNLETLNKTAIGTLIKVDAVRLLNDQLVCNKNYIIKGINARKRFSIDDYRIDQKTDKIKIIVSHDPIVLEPVIYDYLLAKDIAKVTDADIIFCAHIHSQFDVEIKGKRFINPGPFTRQNINESKIEPKICLLEI